MRLALVALLFAAAPVFAQSTVTLRDGSVWEGGVSRGEPSGPGTLTKPDGTVLRGRIVAGDWTGLLTVEAPSGVRMTKELLAGLPNGRHAWLFRGGARLETTCTVETGAHTAFFVHADGERVPVQISADCQPVGEAYERALLAATARRLDDPEPSGGMPPATSSGGPGAGAVGALVESQRWCLSGDCRNGRGRMRLPDGEVYTGGFAGGERHGAGTLVVPGMGTYVGAWQHDVRHGEGTFTYDDGGVYTGTFVAGQPSQGRRTWPSGEVYTGRFYQWIPNGQGTFTWPDGARHAGLFRDGDPHGEGTFTFPDGRSWTGAWDAGRARGAGLWRDADGRSVRRAPF